MASSRPPGDAPYPSRRRRGSVPNEEGLRALGSHVGQGGEGSVPHEAPLRALGSRGSQGAQSARPRTPGAGNAANEDGLRALGSEIDRTGATGAPRAPGGPGRGGRGTGGVGNGGNGRRRSGRARWSGRRKVVTAVAVAVAVVLLLVAGSYGYLQYRFSQFSKVHVAAEQQPVSGQPFNMLVLGSDSRSGLNSPAFGSAAQVTGQRSDVNMIWHVDPGAHKITIVSIPRDTLVSMVGSDVSQYGRFNRINSAYGSGPNQLVMTIEANFGIPINHVVQVNFSGFQGAVDALGGVWMNFAYPAKDAYSGLDIATPGCQLLNGGQALAVARSRHYQYEQGGTWQYDGTSDFGRIQRQDQFLRALVSSAKSKVNPLTINAFLGSLPQGVTIDDRFHLNDLLRLAFDFHSFDPGALVTHTLPTTSVGAVSPWGDVLFVDQPAAQQMLASIFGSSLASPTSPPPNTNLEPTAPPSVAPPPPPAAAASPAPSSGAAAVPAAPPPPFDPIACSPH